MKKWSVKMLVEAGIMIALSAVLSKIKIFQAPQGGSITAGSMIPIMLFALRWGLKPGVLAGATFGILKIILGSYVFSPAQAILEYPVAFGCLGLVGLFSETIKTDSSDSNIKIISSVFLAVLGRFLCHFLAGVIFFSEYAEGQNPVLYSLIYQSSYLIPEFIISAIIISVVWKPLKKAGI